MSQTIPYATEPVQALTINAKQAARPRLGCQISDFQILQTPNLGLVLADMRQLPQSPMIIEEPPSLTFYERQQHTDLGGPDPLTGMIARIENPPHRIPTQPFGIPQVRPGELGDKGAPQYDICRPVARAPAEPLCNGPRVQRGHEVSPEASAQPLVLGTSCGMPRVHRNAKSRHARHLDSVPSVIRPHVCNRVGTGRLDPQNRTRGIPTIESPGHDIGWLQVARLGETHCFPSTESAMPDQIGDLDGEPPALRSVGETNKDGDSVGQIFKNRFQEVHRARKSGPCLRKTHPPKTRLRPCA